MCITSSERWHRGSDVGEVYRVVFEVAPVYAGHGSVSAYAPSSATWERC